MSLKRLARRVLPLRHQVPAKYWYNRLCGALEDEMDLLDQLVRRDSLAIDVGGNRGIYAYLFWKLAARVEVFEPNPVCVRDLGAWAADKPHVRIHPVALSSRTGSADLHIPVDEAGVEHDASASIEHAGFAHARDERVSLRTLDSYGFENVSLVKIDVEGHECDVIDGAAETLAASRPALLVEIEQRHTARPIDEVFERVRGAMYQGFFLEAGSLQPLEDFDVARHQSKGNFGRADATYINNFLFLDRGRLVDGEYASLVACERPR